MRLIDADVLKNSLTEYFNRIKKIDKRRIKQLDAIYLDVISAMESSPIIETKPIEHGKWIENDNGTYSCSECHSWIPNEQHHYARYCLYCGAKMEEAE